MTDLREKQPAVRHIEPMPAANYEVELKAWPYSSIKSENVISRKLIYRLHADSFAHAFRMAVVLRDTVRAMHDIWISEIVRIEECGA
jgi:hypothetical protein